jgi:hypothetical protein
MRTVYDKAEVQAVRNAISYAIEQLEMEAIMNHLFYSPSRTKAITGLRAVLQHVLTDEPQHVLTDDSSPKKEV